MITVFAANRGSYDSREAQQQLLNTGMPGEDFHSNSRKNIFKNKNNKRNTKTTAKKDESSAEIYHGHL